MADPRRLQDAKDSLIAALYAKRDLNSEDVYPVLTNTLGELVIAGSFSLSTTASTITNAPGNPVNVALSSTKVTVDNTVTVTGTVTPSSTASTITNAAANPVPVSLTTTKVTVDNTVTVTGTVTPSTTASTITNAAGNPVNVSLTTTKVTVDNTVTVTGTVTPSTTASTITNAVGNPVNVSLTSTVVTISNTAGTVTNSVSTLVLISKTLTGSTGSVSTTNTTISATPAGGSRIKVYAISLTMTVTTALICVFNSGGVANGLELWRVLLQAPSGASAGANLAVTPPGFLFASRAGTAVSLSLSTAAVVHYSISYYEEA